MTAIITTYIGATNHRPARIKADAGMGRKIIVSYNSEGDMETAHFRAVKALCKKWKWAGYMTGGGTENGFAFVFTPKHAEARDVTERRFRPTSSNKVGSANVDFWFCDSVSPRTESGIPIMAFRDKAGAIQESVLTLRELESACKLGNAYEI